MPKGMGGDQDDAEEFEAGEHLNRTPESALRNRSSQNASATPLGAQTAKPEAEQVRSPGDDHADRDRDQAGGDSLVIT